MYGNLHIILKDLVVTVAGASAWDRVCAEAKLSPETEAELLEPILQGEAVTNSLILATSKVLGISSEVALRTFGRHFVDFAIRSGNAVFMRSFGATFHDFLKTIDQVHASLERDLPDAQFPWLEHEYDAESGGAFLTYLSCHRGLANYLIGIVKEIGRRLYHLEVTFQAVDVPEDLAEPFRMGKAGAWRITWRDLSEGPEPPEPQDSIDQEGTPEVVQMPFAQLHASLVNFMAAFRALDIVAACRCKDGVAAGNAVVPTECASDDGSWKRTDFPLAVKCQSSRRKSVEVASGGRPLDCILLRGTRAERVAASWLDSTRKSCSAFWASASGRAEDYELSEDATHVDAFVSHSWGAPENWTEFMGDELDYADVKSVTLAMIAKDIARDGHSDAHWGSVLLWVDKACVPQDSPVLKAKCIALLERFIHHSDYVCVLFTWSYLERLWCVYEWACILVDKEPRKVWLANEHFVTEQTLPLYLEAVRSFSLKGTKCFVESDRSVLHRKIDDHYVSHIAFEGLVKAAATAFMARSMAFRAGTSATNRDRFFTPWVVLAAELQVDGLAKALGTCKATEWRGEATANQDDSPSRVRATKYHERINAWFDEEVEPVLQKLLDGATRHS